MLAGGYSWRLFFYVEIALAGALLILAFVFVEESTYHRKIPALVSPTIEPTTGKDEKIQHQEDISSIPPRKSFLSTLKPWSKIDPDTEFFMTMLRPFTYFFVPAVFWVITTYGEKDELANKGLDLLYSRYIYWSWGIGIQLYIPNQDRSTSL